jgi:chromate transporter
VSSSDPPANVEPSRLQIFMAFATISLCGFGGVLAWSRRVMVEERRWMTADEFNDLYALCNFLPGPNIVNFSAVFGGRFGGVAGALTGLLGPPFAIVLGTGALYAHFGGIDAFRRMFAAVAAAAAGLLISTIIKTLPSPRPRPGPMSLWSP